MDAEFGLGLASIIDSVRIEWPSGIIWDTTAVQVNQFLTIFEHAEISDGLVAYYPFNGNANDESGNGNHGVENGGVNYSAVDRFGNAQKAVQFDGADDFIEVVNDPTLNFGAGPFSIGAWINTGGQFTTDWTLIAMKYDMSNYGYVFGIYDNDYPDNGGRIYFNVNGGGGSQNLDQDWILSDQVVADNRWHDIWVVRGEDNLLQIYIDGELSHQGSIPTTNNVNNSSNMYIGKDTRSVSPKYLNGSVDELRMYNRAISPTEIETFFREGLISLEIGNVSASTAYSILVPIDVTFPPGDLYRSAELNFSGFSSGLVFTGIETAGTMLENLGWSIQHNENQSMLLTAYAGTNDVSGSGVFCYLMFDVVGEVCSTIPINVEYAKFNSNEWVETTSGGVTISPVPDFGDVDQNGTVEALDASDVLLHVLDDTYLDCEGLANADTYLDGAIDGMDASIILRYLVELEDALPVTPAEGFLAVANLTTEDQNAVPGSVVQIPLNIDSGQNIYAFEGTIVYDPAILAPDENMISWSSLLDGFMISTEIDEGQIRFVGASSTPDGQAGVFAMLNFTMVEDIEVGNQTTVTLESIKFNSNLVIEDISAIVSSVVSVDPVSIPESYILQQNFPNPFNPSTTIRYGLPEETAVSLIIYDIKGVLIQTLKSEHQPAGWYDVVWNGQTTEGKAISTGIYFARLIAGDYSQVVKMLYLK